MDRKLVAAFSAVASLAIVAATLGVSHTGLFSLGDFEPSENGESDATGSWKLVGKINVENGTIAELEAEYYVGLLDDVPHQVDVDSRDS